jgi:hypothetical protein
MWMCGVCWHMKESQSQLILGEDIITSNSLLEILGKLCSPTVQQQQQSYSSTGHYTCSFCSQCLSLSECELSMSMDRKRRTKCVTPLFPDLTPLFFFGAMWKANCSVKVQIWWTWITAAIAVLQCICQEKCCSGMYAELMMALTFKCFAPNNFPLFQWMNKTLQTTPSYPFSLSYRCLKSWHQFW